MGNYVYFPEQQVFLRGQLRIISKKNSVCTLYKKVFANVKVGVDMIRIYKLQNLFRLFIPTKWLSTEILWYFATYNYNNI